MQKASLSTSSQVQAKNVQQHPYYIVHCARIIIFFNTIWFLLPPSRINCLSKDNLLSQNNCHLLESMRIYYHIPILSFYLFFVIICINYANLLHVGKQKSKIITLHIYLL